jgi:CheY-like chemotaxis protein
MKSILVIDDDEDIQKILRAYLKDLYDIHSAYNGAEALTLLRSGTISPDLIILDMEMPRMNGKEMIKALKADPNLKHFPVIYFSAEDKYKDEVDLEADYCFLNKPIEKDDLLSVLDSFFRMRS